MINKKSSRAKADIAAITADRIKTIPVISRKRRGSGKLTQVYPY